jgi:hypothetical protein
MSASVQQPAAAADAAPAEHSSVREWLSAREVAQLIGVSQRRVHQAVRRGELRAAVLDSRGRIVVHRNWARAWLERLADDHAFAGTPDGRRDTAADFKCRAAGDRVDLGNEGQE